MTDLLLASGANVNLQGGFFGSALLAAIAQGHDVLSQRLLNQTGDQARRDAHGRSPLLQACLYGHVHIAERLSNNPLELTALDYQECNCLHLAAASGSAEMVSWVLKHSIDPNATDIDGWTPLHWAAKRVQLQSARLLIGAGATSKVEKIQGWEPVTVALYHHEQDRSTFDKAEIIHTFDVAGIEIGKTALQPRGRHHDPEGSKTICNACHMVSFANWKLW